MRMEEKMNEWQPIETAPEGKFGADGVWTYDAILLSEPKRQMFIGLRNHANEWLDFWGNRVKPTKWKPL